MVNNRRETLVLLLGDIGILYVALFVTLFLRYQVIPTGDLLEAHLLPFSILFAVWILVFFIAGLYEKRAVVFTSRLPSIIWNAQLANSVIGAIFFYFLPVFDIAPKTNLFIDLVLSFILIVYWRTQANILFNARKSDDAILVARGDEMKELFSEINGNPRYGLHFVSVLDLDTVPEARVRGAIEELLRHSGVKTLVADLDNEKLEPVLPFLYDLIFSNFQLVRMHDVYEGVFLRVPLTLVGHSWFLENISTSPKRMYDSLKRIMDIVASIVLFVATLPFDLLAFVAIKFDDGGPAFIVQERLGKNDKPIRIYKFRTMTTDDGGEYGREEAKVNKVTRVGTFLRKSRIDEFPQFWNVITGSLSLVGPRPELPVLARLYHDKVPYYRVRHLIKPGLSGWAQIYHENHPHHGEAVLETKEKLSYDLYYVKNRSFLLDLKIALRTVQTLLSRSGK